MNLLCNPHRLLAHGFAAALAGMAVNSAMGFKRDGAPPGAACS